MTTPTSVDTPNQAIYEDNQNFNIDLSQLVADWIVPIDELRSYAGIVGQNSSILSALQKSSDSSITSIAKSIKIEVTPQESRCHAFYRWIGFPVVDSSMTNIYNPGFDIIKSDNRKITHDFKIRSANSPIVSPKSFNDISLLREHNSKSYLKIFSKPKSIDAAILALSNGATKKLRTFVTPFEKSTDPFDMDAENQSFQVDLFSLVGENEISLRLYQGSGGEFASNQFESKRYHIIKPFIVDPRIDFTVSPQSRLVAVPFVPNSMATKVDSISKVRRPLIEKIIRDRFSVRNVSEKLGTFTNTILRIVAAYPKIKDNDLVKLANNPNNALKQFEQIQLEQSINVIKALMEMLVEARNTIKEVQREYYWVPVPSTSGPEGGCSVQGVFLPTIIAPELITEKDFAIFVSEALVRTEGINGEAINTLEEPDPRDFGIFNPSGFISFSSDTTSALGNNAGQNLETLTERRNRRLMAAGEALQTIEIITGDFSGLGLCDIVAIISALNVIPKENLLGFLDTDALARARQAIPELKNVTPVGYQSAMQTFANTVKDFYNLMDKIYEDSQNHNGIP